MSRAADIIQQREAQLHKRETENQRSRLRADEIFSDVDSDDDRERKKSESGSEFERKLSSSSSSRSSTSSNDSDADVRHEDAEESNVEKLQVITTKEELKKICLSRFRLEKWVFLPFFKELVIGCFVRVGIGSFKGKSVYRVILFASFLLVCCILLFKY